ncbi:carboxypeptidase-like regulatory domain-containing protein [Allomuricauda sp. SCSIO 65647]|uniref:carboxypeptidase-like regulatory domain-containing protein n=1 Tax=Allomuricauda sp. SCSIO 65647 TaxID=2908843 RepID=UPI001F4182DE|nr:carboxypeptidase-like regulatory domain-containing protein [Muricauda sp. SCSIO 65647]UJH67134.1 carboxypeptidase-like regulatory domain-containing protein [Muricauda sp. SCSIO 65647]
MKLTFLVHIWAIFLLVIPKFGFSTENFNVVSGYITNSGKPLPKASVIIKNSSTGVVSDENGFYTIEVDPRQVLIFSYVGMRSVEIVVEDITSVLNVEMFPKVEELDEVVLVKKKWKTQKDLKIEYPLNKNLINTSIGILDKERAGFSMQIIDGDDLNLASSNLVQALAGKFGGRIDWSDPNDPAIIIRGRKAGWEVDGTPTLRAPMFINVAQIDRIAIISGLAAYAKFGGPSTEGGGLIIINTKGTNATYEPNTTEPYDYARLRDNEFDESTLTKYVRAAPSLMIKELIESENEEEALATLDKNWAFYSKSAYNLLDISTYFREVLKNEEKADTILAKIEQLFHDNPVALKALAYRYEEIGQIEKAKATYMLILKLRPRYAQSYRDLANIYTKNIDVKNAYEIYLRYIISRRMDTLSNPLEGIDSIIRTEVVNLKDRPINTWRQVKTFEPAHTKSNYWPLRIVVEWNNSEADFDLQFVHPENQYFIWNHTLRENADRIYSEKQKGYSSEQFFMDENSKGIWKINLHYYGNKGFDPTYFKITAYHDYGTKFQTEEIKIFKAVEKNVRLTMWSVENVSRYSPVR